MRTYQASLSLIFFVANLVNSAFFFFKLTRVPQREIGTIKLLISRGLILMMLFNLPYKLVISSPLLLLDSLINSMTETYMLFLNLVISHSMYASLD